MAVATDHVDLLGLPLHTGPDIFDGEAAMPHDANGGILQLIIVDAVVGTVANIATKFIATGPFDVDRVVEGTWTANQRAHLQRLRCVFRGQVQLIVPPIQGVALHLQFLQRGVEPGFLIEAMSFPAGHTHLQNGVATGPGLHVLGAVRCRIQVLWDVGSLLRLQLGRLIGHVTPGGATEGVVALQNDEIGSTMPQEIKGCHEAAHPSSKDGNGMIILSTCLWGMTVAVAA
mmetsp:Transcript_27897/g.60803  ORF Transcript_27897/g.60803 Transcript_27897/m.60803 type:complete len:230 (-) Transcript_27897:48-737(-)